MKKWLRLCLSNHRLDVRGTAAVTREKLNNTNVGPFPCGKNFLTPQERFDWSDIEFLRLLMSGWSFEY